MKLNIDSNRINFFTQFAKHFLLTLGCLLYPERYLIIARILDKDLRNERMNNAQFYNTISIPR